MPTLTCPKRLNRPWQKWTTLKGRKPKSLWHGRVVPCLEELESRLNPSAIGLVPPPLDTTPAWDQSSSIAPFGIPDTATYGETFLAPANTTLSDFSFHIQGSSGVHLSMKGYVYAWSDPLAGGDGQAVGSALFSSPSISFVGNENDTFQTVTVQTGATALQAGQAYVIFLTVSNPDDYANSTGTTDWGYLGQHVTGDGGGTFVFNNNENNFGALTSGTWESFSGDLAFTADFGQSVGTPPSITGQPADSTVAAGASASFTATAGGSPSSVQWLAEAPGAQRFSAISDGDVYGGTTTGTLTINNAPADLSGYQFEAVFTNGAGQATSNPATLSVADQIAYTAPALTVAAGANTGAFTFQVEDQNGDAVALPSQVIQLQTSDGTGQFFTTDGTPLNGSVTTGADGSANFVYQDTLAGKPTLTLTDASLNFTASPQLTVNAGPASQIAFVQVPTDTKFGQPINPDVEARVEDAFDNPILGDTVTLTADGPNGAQTVFTAVSDVNGLADFKNVVLNAVGAYTVTATDGAADSGPSRSFNVSPLAPTQLNFLQPPGNSTAGQFIGTDVRVQALNPAGPIAPGTVTLSVVSGPGGFDPASTLTVPIDANGVADFNNLILNVAGGYVLGASYTPSAGGPALASPFSSTFTVFPAAVTLTPSGPQVDAGVPSVPVGDSFGLSGGFTEQGQGPPGGVLVRVSWGDGAVETDPVTVTGGQGAFTASHMYQTQGAYSVTVLVTDAAGNVIGVGALPAPVEVLPAGSGTVNTVDAGPGATVTQSATDVVSGTVTTVTLTVAPGDQGGELLTAGVENFVPPPTPGVLQTVASFEVRQEDLQQGDSALITFVVPRVSLESGTVPQLYFQDPTTGKEILFSGVSSITPAGNTLVITILLNNSSTPKLTDLAGTVFTVAATTPGPAAVATVGPAVASTASGPVALQAASFQSTSQLTLTLAASQASQASTSRSSLSADGGGGDEPISDADADALLRFLFEKLDLLPKLRLPRNASDAIRLWLNQVGLATPDGAPTDAVVVPAEGRLEALDHVYCEPPAAVGRFVPVAIPGGAHGVVVPPRAKSGAALLGAVPLAGLGLGLARRKKKKHGRDGERGAQAP